MDEGRLEETEATVGARLAREIRQGRLAREDIELLRGQLGLDLRAYADDPDGSVEARLAHLQSEVTTLAAYTDAVEELLDEQGTARQFVEAARADIDALERQTSDLEGVAGRHAGRLDSLETATADLRETVEAFDQRLDALEEAVADLEAFRDDIEGVFQS